MNLSTLPVHGVHPAEKHPIRNPVWSQTSQEHVDGEFVQFVTDDSDLRAAADCGEFTDPWGRPLPPTRTPHFMDDELVFWTCTTTVEGQEVVLKIFND